MAGTWNKTNCSRLRRIRSKSNEHTEQHPYTLPSVLVRSKPFYVFTQTGNWIFIKYCINLGDGGKRCEGVPDGLQLGIDRVLSLRLPLLRPVPWVLLCPRLQQCSYMHTVLSSCLPRAGRSSTWRGGWGWPARRGRGRGPWWGCAHCGCWGRVDACIFTFTASSGDLAGPQRSGWHLAWPLCKPRKISGATWRANANIHHDAAVSLVCKTIAVSVTLDTDLIRLAACRILHIGHNSLPVLQCCSAVLQCTTLHYAQYWNCCWLLQHPSSGDKVNTFWITLFYLETGY